LYEKKLQSTNSPYDQFLKGGVALNPSQEHGRQLFFSEKLKCSSCHGGALFTNASISKKIDSVYFNIGLYNIQNKNSYPSTDIGLQEKTSNVSDNGKFKAPSLRNVALTAPYMHDGSMASLDEVIDMYARGGRNTTSTYNYGDGKLNKNKHAFISGFEISKEEKQDLIHFLETLTDTSYLCNLLYQNHFNFDLE
jgi:cytochrome c peroxidase